MKQVKVTRQEALNPWLKALSPKRREDVLSEVEKQKRAYKDMVSGSKPQRTARRIIQRSQHRINYIIADELVKGGGANA